jgi:hypothetical protein
MSVTGLIWELSMSGPSALGARPALDGAKKRARAAAMALAGRIGLHGGG